jgi:hypothetical protein
MVQNNLLTLQVYQGTGRKGQKAAQTYYAIMDLPPPPRFECFYRALLDSLVDVSSMYMKNAVKEVEMNDGDKHES